MTAIFQEHILLRNTIEGAIWPCVPAHWKPAHFHSQLEFLLMLRGHARARIGGATYAIHPGQLIWFLPGVEHEITNASSDCNFVVVQVEPDLCADVGRSLQSRAGSEPLAPGYCSFDGWITELGWLASGRPVVELTRSARDQLLEACDATCADVDLRADECSTRLRAALSAAWLATRQHHDDRRTNSVVELACCLLLEEPALERSAISRKLDVSESYLSRRFRRELGVSFLEQRTRLRLARFSTHVARDRQSYLDAALLAGFGSYSQLHRVFTDHLRVNPRQYFSQGGRNARANI